MIHNNIIPNLIITKQHRLLAYRIDRRLEFPPDNSLAETWVETGNGNHYKWNHLAASLARFEYCILNKIDNWDDVVINLTEII